MGLGEGNARVREKTVLGTRRVKRMWQGVGDARDRQSGTGT